MRLDNYLVDKGYFDTRTKAKQAIVRGEIFVNSVNVFKPAFIIDGEANIKRVCDSSYVSVGGFKLEKALRDFDFNVNGLTVADIGASTGGFSDCLIANGAKKVFAVDLRNDLLHESLKKNNKVVQIEKNAKDLCREDFSDTLDLVVADLSFISIANVINVFNDLIDAGKKIIILIKPQFEIGEKKKFKNGIVRDNAIHKKVCENVYKVATENGLAPLAVTCAPKISEKNLEFLMLFEKGGKALINNDFFLELNVKNL